MQSLREILLAPSVRDRMVADTTQLVENHIASQSGLRGVAYKTALTMLKAARPGIVERGIRRLLPDFLAALEPWHQRFRSDGAASFSAALAQEPETATAELLAVADARVANASDLVRKTYARFRGDAANEAARILPLFAQLVDRHLKKA